MKQAIATATASAAIGAAAAGPSWVQVAALALFVADSARRAAR